MRTNDILKLLKFFQTLIGRNIQDISLEEIRFFEILLELELEKNNAMYEYHRTYQKNYNQKLKGEMQNEKIA